MTEDRELIAHCGLYCGDCFNYKGEIADLSRDLRKKLREARFDRVSQGLSKYFKQLSNYGECYEALGAMVRLRCRRACRSGGGNPACKIRICCQRKNIAGCWECSGFATCTKLDFLEPIHGDACQKNLTKLKRRGVEDFLQSTRDF